MSTITHLRALLRKNWLLWKRNMVGSILELFGPIAFIFLFLVFRYAEPIVNVPETSYYQIASRFTSPEVHTTWIKACNNAQIGGKIALAPPDDPIILQYEQAVTSLGFSTLMFADNDAINDYIKSSGYGSGDKRICYGVVMQKNDVDNTYEYLIRYNVTLLTGTKTQDIPNTNPPEFEQIEPQDLDSFNKYVRSGFLTVQTWVDNLIFRQEIDPSFVLQADIASVTVPAYKRDYIILNLKGMTQYIVGMPILLPFLRMVTGILREKEKRIREGMKIMGLQNSAFYLSWFITYFIIMSVISAAIAVILRYIYFFHSHIGWLFLWHWEYSIWLISLGILVSVFFNKAKIGGIAAFLIVAVMGWFYFIVSGDDATANSRFWASMVPPTSLGLSGDYLLSLEAGQKGLTSETVNMEYLNYNMIDHYIWMAIDIVVFLVLAAYLDQVLPSDFGIKKHPLFCLLRKKKRIASTPKNLEEEQSYLQGNINFEETDPTLKNQDKNNESIVIDNLRKVYKNGKLAVDGVSYNMYRGQIFVLLGHNGAGKTSTISMITGLYPPTEGTANVFGMDIREKLEDIRKIMGVCPQHDVLYDELTVKEHLELFAIFKGMNPKDIPQEVNKLIADLDLNEKRDYLSKNLSGGQKRRLSIAIAFIGGSKFILLDEPSSGMDTASRRRLWDMLKNYKHGRVVLLTTHFMDEADYLGDRIGIMGEGKMQCLGRPLFLKNRFGVGYTLTISKKDIKDESEPIIKFIQEYIPESKVVTNISSEITMQLPLETVGKFEQLFDNLDKNLEKLRIDTYGVSVTTLEQVFLNVARLLMKEDKNRIQAVGSESQLGKTPSVEGGEDLDNFDLQKQKITGFWNLFITQFGALIMKRLRYFRRDKNGLVLELFLPVIMVIIGIILIKAQTIATGDILEMTDDFFGDAFQVRYNSLLSDNSAVDSNLINEFNPTTFQMVQVPGNSLAQFNTEIYANRNIDPFSKFNAFFDTVSTSISKYTTLIDTRAKDACPFALNKINNALLKYLKNNSNKQIKLIIAPFEQTPQGAQTFKNVIDGLSIAFVFATAMSFIPTSLITFIVKEKELTVKHQQLVSGISIQSYWCANYLVDLLKYMFPSVLNCLMALAFNAEAIIQGELYGCLWALFMAYGFSVTAFSYLTSFLFKDFGLSQTVTFFFNFGTGFLGGLAIGLLRVFPRTNAIALVLHWFFRPLPTFALTYGLMNLTNRAAYANVEGDTTLRTPWSLDLTGGDVLYLVSTAVLYFVLIFVVEFVKTNKFFVNTLVRNATEPGNRRIDQDVIAEEKRVESTTASNFSIKVDKLRKVYRLGRNKNKVAVNQVSFGIGNGDCFALLGVNGAGKTTTFKMLSGDVLPTAGRAFINGHEIPAQMSQARHHIGYCPQHDPLLDLLTAREHLYLYAAIKGVPYDKRKRMVEKLLKDLNLTQYADIPSGSYSGGNKRKLSVAIAMVGNPPIVFLDEPSTGMDPEARRFMWNVISRISRERKKSSVILTTHSMEEAEALCTKMGIMVNGALRCLGTAQHIKSIYGGGYEIEIKLNAVPKTDVYENIKALGYEINALLTKEQVETMLTNSKASELIKEIAEEGSGSAVFMELKRGNVAVDFVVDWMLMEKNGWRLREFLKIHFDKVVLIEHFQSFYRFNIASNISIAKVFGKIEENKELFKIMQYSVKQSTIEQIFNVFANEKSENQQQPELLGSPSDDKNEGVALEVEPKSGSSSSRAGHGIRKTLSISRKSHDNKVYRTLSIDNHDDNIIK